MSIGRLLPLFLTSPQIAVTILVPTEGAVLTDAEVAVQWTFSPGTQQTFRVQAIDSLGATAYDSGIIASAALTHTIPEGFLDTGQSYTIRVSITTTAGQSGQGTVDVTTAFPPSVNVVNITVAAVGEDCDTPSGGSPGLPGLEIRWDEVVPAVTETFVRYSVWRRAAGETDSDWVRVASIADVGDNRLIDYVPTSRIVYEYAVTWTALDAGDTLVSLKQDPPANGHTDFDFIWLHDWNTPGSQLQFFSLASGVAVEQDQRELALWGRQAPTLFIGEKEFRRVSLSGLPALHRGGVWVDLQTLVAAQRTAATVLVLRIGFSGESMFCQVVRSSKDNRQKQFEPSVELLEVFFEEGVS